MITFPLFSQMDRYRWQEGSLCYLTNGAVLLELQLPEGCHVADYKDTSHSDADFASDKALFKGILAARHAVDEPYVSVLSLPTRDLPLNDGCHYCDGTGVAFIVDEDCTECDGEGMKYCSHCDNYNDCHRCGGRGSIRIKSKAPCSACLGLKTPADYKAGNAVLAFRYVRMLLDLPDCLIATPTTRDEGVPFTFTGGRGVVMPLNCSDSDA